MATLPDEIRVRFVHDSLPTGVLIELDGRPVTDPDDAYSLDDANQDDHDVVMRSSMVAVEAVLNALGYTLDERRGYLDGDLTMMRFFRRKDSDHRNLKLPRPLITDHPYQGLPDGLYCTYDCSDIDHIDFCNLPRSEHPPQPYPSARDPFGLLTDEDRERLHDDLTEMARQRRRAEDDAGGISMP
jgi:hypothetical protein